MKRVTDKPKIIAMVPAKLGSTRLRAKNLVLLNGRPLVYYAIEAAKRSGAFSSVVVNAEDPIFSKIAIRYDAEFYLRPRRLVKATTKTDEVVYDFLKNNPCDMIAWVSPIAPLQPPHEVAAIVEYFIREGLDSLMTVKNEQVHCVYKKRPINFCRNEIFAQTQDLEPVQAFVYSVMMWRSRTFMRCFEKNGYALLCGKAGFFPVSKLSSVIVKRKEDLLLAQSISEASRRGRVDVRYDKIINSIRRKGSIR